MYIKCLTNQIVAGPDSIQPHALFPDVSELHVEDYWVDDDKSSTTALPRKAGFDNYYLFKPSQAAPSTEIPSHQQQHIILYFTSGGKSFSVCTAFPTYVMNEKGSTVQSYVPVSK